MVLILGFILLFKFIVMLENGCLLDGMGNGVVVSFCVVFCIVKDEMFLLIVVFILGFGVFFVGCSVCGICFSVFCIVWDIVMEIVVDKVWILIIIVLELSVLLDVVRGNEDIVFVFVSLVECSCLDGFCVFVWVCFLGGIIYW